MLYIITAVHNRIDITKKFISLLKKQTYKDFRLIIVDDGSTDDTDKMVKKELSESIILYGSGNLWWAGALNKVYKYIKKNNFKENGDLLIINDDTKFEQNFLEIGMNLLKENENSLITGCGYSSITEEHRDGAILFDLKTGNQKLLSANSEGNCASTRALFMKINSFLKIGRFHPILLPHYASDYEFTIRAWKKGFKIKSFERLKYYINEETTGYHSNKIQSKNFSLKKIFSKKSSYNPIYRISFIVLITPLKYIIPRIFNQIKNYIKILK